MTRGSTEIGDILDVKTFGRPSQMSRTMSREAASKKILPGNEVQPNTHGDRKWAGNLASARRLKTRKTECSS